MKNYSFRSQFAQSSLWRRRRQNCQRIQQIPKVEKNMADTMESCWKYLNAVELSKETRFYGKFIFEFRSYIPPTSEEYDRHLWTILIGQQSSMVWKSNVKLLTREKVTFIEPIMLRRKFVEIKILKILLNTKTSDALILSDRDNVNSLNWFYFFCSWKLIVPLALFVPSVSACRIKHCSIEMVA